jgi:hypothetical protein
MASRFLREKGSERGRESWAGNTGRVRALGPLGKSALFQVACYCSCACTWQSHLIQSLRVLLVPCHKERGRCWNRRQSRHPMGLSRAVVGLSRSVRFLSTHGFQCLTERPCLLFGLFANMRSTVLLVVYIVPPRTYSLSNKSFTEMDTGRLEEKTKLSILHFGGE